MPSRSIAILAGVLLSLAPTLVHSAENAKGTSPVLEFKAKSLEGKEVDFSKYQGKVLLVVNSASACGYTPQYKDLEALHEKFGKDGLAVVAFPCNQFGKQEPGSAQKIRDFCTSKFHVTFDLFEKIDVKGKNQSPLYKWLTSEEATPTDPGVVKWNFEKFLIGRDGKVIARYRSRVNPSSPEVVEAIETALKK
ncbi:MAG TPA: glutathione peroxidase [Pirellulales bacterium]